MAVVWFLAGGLAEWVNMLVRRWTVMQSSRLKPGGAVALVLLGFLFRLAWMALVLGLAVAWSPVYGIAAFVGFWVSRWVLIGRIVNKAV